MKPQSIYTSSTPAQKLAEYLRQIDQFDRIVVLDEYNVKFQLQLTSAKATDFFIKNLSKATQRRLFGVLSSQGLWLQLNVGDAPLPWLVQDISFALGVANEYINFWMIQDHAGLLYGQKIASNPTFGLHAN